MMTESDAIRSADGILRKLRERIGEIESSIGEIKRRQELASGPLKFYYQTATEQQLQYNLTGIGGVPLDEVKAKALISERAEALDQYGKLESAIRDSLNSLMAEGPGIYRDILSDRLIACLEEAANIIKDGQLR